MLLPRLLSAPLGTYEAIPPILEDSFETLAVENGCPITAAAFLNVIVDLFVVLISSNSKSHLHPSHCILRTVVGEKAESCSLLVLGLGKKFTTSSPASALQRSPLMRCITLANYVHGLKSRQQSTRSPSTRYPFSKAETDALWAVNMALQNMSDDNDLAVLRFCSARELRWASDVWQCSEAAVGKITKNSRQFDYTLALRGYTLGERYARKNSATDVQAWILLLYQAGGEHSVSTLNWCTDDLLKPHARIFVLGQQQFSQ